MSKKAKTDRQRLPAPTAADYEHDRYVTTVENLRATLDRFGVAIVDSVLTQEETENMKRGMWDFVEHATAICMLIQHWGIGQAQFLWDVRQNPNVANTFSALWNTPADDLLVSFDGASFGMPSEITKRGYYRGNQWFHVDQRFSDSQFRCVQSWVTADDVRPGDATLTIIEVRRGPCRPP